MKRLTNNIAILATAATIGLSAPLLADTTHQPAPSSTEERVQHLLDHQEITQVIINYGLAFDMLDFELHRSVFTDEIEMDFSASIGDGLVTLRADDWVEAVKPFFQNLNGTQHITMPLSIWIDGDQAYVRSMLNATHHLPNSKGGSLQTMVGHYDNWLVRTSKGWKIRKVVQHITWNDGNWYVFEKAAGLSD